MAKNCKTYGFKSGGYNGQKAEYMHPLKGKNQYNDKA